MLRSMNTTCENTMCAKVRNAGIAGSNPASSTPEGDDTLWCCYVAEKVDANWNGTGNPLKRAAVRDCGVQILTVARGVNIIDNNKGEHIMINLTVEHTRYITIAYYTDTVDLMDWDVYSDYDKAENRAWAMWNHWTPREQRNRIVEVRELKIPDSIMFRYMADDPEVCIMDYVGDMLACWEVPGAHAAY